VFALVHALLRMSWLYLLRNELKILQKECHYLEILCSEVTLISGVTYFMTHLIDFLSFMWQFFESFSCFRSWTFIEE
jgi:hypothetical protein